MLSRAKSHVALAVVMVITGALLSVRGLNAGEAGRFASIEGKLSAERPAGATNHRGRVSLLSSTFDGVAFELDVPWEELIVEPVSVGGGGYVRVALPGWDAISQAGAPELPFLAQAIGVPFGVKVDLRVVPGPAHTTMLPAPALPAATQKVELDLPGAKEGTPALPVASFAIEEDPAIYARDAVYPGVLAEVASDGVLRQQRMAGIAAYPVQYNPATREITVYESLRVDVRFEGFEGEVHTGSAAAESAAYEQVLRQQLLNYETARAWRQHLTLETLEAGTQGGTLPWAPPDPGWRVKVREEGFYRLTYAELQAAGLPVNTPLPNSTFQLSNLGSEVAIQVSDADEDGVFDPEDSLLFYAQAVASKYTADNVYWLTYGQGAGLRMGSRDATPGEATTPTYYAAQHQMEGNGYYRKSAPGDDALERWLWDYVFPPSRPSWTHTFSLAAPYDGDYAATLTVVMLGSLANAINPDHHVTMRLNGTEVADEWWDGITWKTVQVPVAQGLLQAGDNTLSVVCPNDTGVGVDYVYFERVALEFADTFVAEANVLTFAYEASGTWKFQVDGFTTDQLAVYDVTNPAAVVRIEGIAVAGLGPYSAVFQDMLAAPTDYWATASSAYRTVQAIEPDTASNLRSKANSVDHIVITHSDFSAQAAQLRDFRAAQGWSAMSVDVQDVYDEFGYGLVGAAPIHDFLAYAYDQWAGAPSFVVLLGDGHFDPKDYLGYGRVSFIPPYLAFADPWSGETAADNRYVTLGGGDTLPDMMLGRLAVNSSAQASAMVDKIVAYEDDPVAGDWQQQVLAVADSADQGGDYAAMSDGLLGCCLPEPYQAQKVYYGLTHTTLSQARTAIQAGINAGALIVNFVGHGGYSLWGEGLFENTDVAGLSNGGKMPVVLPMTCLDGYYVYPQTSSNYDAVGEVVTRAAGKGAVASWSPTGLGVGSGHSYLNRGFFQAAFTDPDGSVMLGEATTAGKLSLWATGQDLELIDTYLLLGDPATVMTIATLPTTCTLQGKVTLQRPGKPAPDPSWQVPLTVTVGSTVHGVSTDVWGQFTVADLQAGSYDIRVKGLHTLANLRSGVTLAPGSNAVDFGTLLEGDANDNNCVNIIDFSVLANGFTPRFDARADFNEDGLVNISDFSLLVSNFARCGDIVVSTPGEYDTGERRQW